MPNAYVPESNMSNEAPGISGLWHPPKGAFLAFSAGFRACLGRKFAQVEIAAILGALLKECKVELVREEGESWNEARERALKCIDDRRTGLAMRMRKKVKVRFVRRL
jgi:cytochrome P450